MAMQRSGPRQVDRTAKGAGGAQGPKKQYFRRRKVCKFCDEKIDVIDYKDVKTLGQFISERGKILPRRLTGTCSRHQRLVAVAIKRARSIAFLPFAAAI